MKLNFKKIVYVFAALTLTMAGFTAVPVSAQSKTKIYVLGDSTSCSYKYDENYVIPRAGWGMYLQQFVNDDAEVVNLALSGRSSKSFTTEDNYQTYLNDVKSGDIVIIQFGHNDEKNSSEEDKATRYTSAEGDKDTEGTFKNSLYSNYIKPAQDAGATPILFTPISRHKYNDDGTVNDSHGLYDDAVRELADELGIECVDMTSITEELYNELGADMSIVYHAVFRDTSKGTDGYDTTHLNHFGAANIARNAAYNLYDIDAVKPYMDIQNINDDGLYCLDKMTRGEFVSYIARLTGKDVEADADGKNQVVDYTPSFADVSADDEYADAIGLAQQLGITNGDDNGNFNADDILTMQDMCVFAERLFKAMEKPLKTNMLVRDVDVVNVDDYAQESVTGVLNAFYDSGMTFDGAEIADRSTCFYLFDVIYDTLYEPQADAEAESEDQLEIVEK